MTDEGKQSARLDHAGQPVAIVHEGFFVYAGARKQADLDALNALANVQAIRLDVTVQADVDAAVATVREGGRGLYGLINNAGVLVMAPLIELREQDLAFQLDANLYGPFRLFLDSFRAEDKTYLGMTPAQYFTIAMLAIGVYFTFLRKPKASDLAWSKESEYQAARKAKIEAERAAEATAKAEAKAEADD